MYQSRRYSTANKSRGWVGTAAIFLIIIILIVVGFFFVQKRDGQGDNDTSPTEQEASFDKTQFSLTDPTSPWVIVNKQNQLDPKDYAPSDLTSPMNIIIAATEIDAMLNRQTAEALLALNAAATKASVDLEVASAYRSYDDQDRIYKSMVNGYGQTEADRQSARPGHSEHQTGWAVDLDDANSDDCRLETCFADTAAAKWLAAHAHEHGFIVRYPEGKESITGYTYEPWHLRYVGKELAEEMHRTGTKTLEEFFDLPAAPSY